MARALARLLAVLLLALPTVASAADEAVVPAADAAELERRLRGILEEHHVPGMSAVIANRDGIVWTKGIGLADTASGRPATSDTLFRVGSISKTFVGLAALKLVEDGRLRLDAPVRSLVPEVAFIDPWEADDPVRVVHLLEHTTGWDDIHLAVYVHDDPTPAPLAVALAESTPSRVSRWRPGTRYAYSNAGPIVTAAIVEKVTGERFEDFVAETFFTPIGMPTADYFDSPRALPLLTTLYHEDGRTPYPYKHILARPSGSLNASAKEMGAYLGVFLDRGAVKGARVLSEASLERMETQTTSWSARGGLTTGYGLHNDVTLDDEGFTWHGHDGAVDGGLASLAYLREHGVGYFFSLNSESGAAYDKIERQIRAYVTKDLPRPPLAPRASVSLETARDFAGWYQPINHRYQFLAFLERILGLVRVSFEGDRMRVAPLLGPAFAFVAVDGRRFREERQGAARLVLMDSDDGRLVQTAHVTNARVNAVVVWTELGMMALFLLALVSVSLFALVWGARLLLRRMPGAPNLHVRVLPLCAALSFAASVAVFALANEYQRAWSAGVGAAAWAFAAFSFLSLAAAVRADRRGMNRWAYGHSLAVSIVFAIASAYLVSSGFLGLRSWI
jgi:CubicO group peptidase (beta-lactamase class C family)